ncbi:F1 capsule-anchoring protein precursor [compost metagenome]
MTRRVLFYFVFFRNKATGFLCFLGLSFSTFAANETVDFDISTLQARGLSSTLNEYFREGKKFSPGVNKITPVINGEERKSISIHFDEKGQPCLHSDDLATLRIKGNQSESDACSDLKSRFPQSEIHLDPGANKIVFVLPPDAIEDKDNFDISQYAVGGTAAMLNYDLLVMKNYSKTVGSENDSEDKKSSSNNIDTFQSNTEEGFNINDWIIRSRQSYSSSGETRSFDQLYTYVQKTLPTYKTVMQAGKISVANSLFSMPQIYGVQFSPESALMASKQSGATVTGIAQTQARVEVRQAGVLIYSTQIPAGSFTLTRLPTLNTTSDLNVSVVEQNGITRTFLVPASSFTHAYSQQETSYSAALGKIDQSSNDSIGASELATFSMSTALGIRSMLGGGVLIAQRYQNVGAQLSTGLANGLSVSGKTILSSDARSQTQGIQHNLSVTMPLTAHLNTNGSVTLQNSGYRDLTDGTPDINKGNDDANAYADSRYKSQYNLGIGYAFGDAGAFNMGWSRVTMFSPPDVTSRWTAGWSKTFSEGTSLSLNAEQDSGDDGDSMLFMNISIPLGSARIGVNMSRTGENSSEGVTFDKTVSDRFNYSLSVNKNSNSDVTAFSSNIHALPKYSQLSLGYSRYGVDSSIYTVGAAGGIVATEQGVLFSPYPLQDTFAVVQIPNISGGEILTPQGPVWTNSEGYAVSSGMAAYGESRMTLVTKSLPKNVDINNGIQIAQVARGSVTSYIFGTVLSRRALIRIHLSEGKLADKGALLYDARDNYITTVAGDGSVFLIDSQLEQTLWLKPPAGPRCQVIFTLSEIPDVDKLYEDYDAQCKF